MAFDTSQLSPEEQSQLLQLLLSSGGESPTGGTMDNPVPMEGDSGNPDEAQDTLLIQRLISEAIGPLQEQVELLTQIVDDEIIGGVTTLYESQQKMSEIQRLQEQYGGDDMFNSDMQDFYKTATAGGESPDGLDLFDKLHEEISGAKSSTPDWSDGMEAPLVQSLHAGLKDKMGKLRGNAGAAPVAVETTKVEAEPVPSKTDEVVKKIKDMKKTGKRPAQY